MRTKTNLRLLRPATFGGRARNGKALIFLLGLLTLLLCFSNVAYGVMLDKPGNDEKQFNEENTIIPGQQKEGQVPEYAPGEVIIKLKAKEEPELLYTQAYSERTAKDVSVLSRLKNEYSLKDEKPVFEGLHNKLKAKNLSLQQLNAQEEAKSPQQAARRPEGAKQPNLLPIYILKTDQDVLETCAKLKQDPDIEYAEPNYKMEIQMVPNDPYYASSGSWGQPYDDLWGLKSDKLNCEPAWDITQGEGAVVAVIDTGVDYNHPDLAQNIWINEDEIPGNGIDDDSNGYVDDVRGWDFAYDDNDPMDRYGHGTHVSGTIAAVGNNNLGVIGVAPRAKIMAVKGLNDGGSGYISDLANCVIYAADNGAHVTNNSWGGRGVSQTLEDVFNYAYSAGVISISASGNSNDDAMQFTPANIMSVMAVSAFTQNDEKCSFSNYGAKIDVAAPGGGYYNELGRGNSDIYNILSTLPDNSSLATSHPELKISDGYWRLAGTSMACPHVAGLAALVKSHNPQFSNDEIRQVIKASADDVGPAGWDNYSGFGRINCARALQIESVCIAQISSPGNNEVVNDIVDIYGTATGDTFSSYTLEYAENTESVITWTPILTSATPVENGRLGEFDTLVLGNGDAHFYLMLRVTDMDGNEFSSNLVRPRVRNLKISNISESEIFRAGDIIEITGTVSARDLARYEIEFYDPRLATWNNTGITLVNNGLLPVTDDILGHWNTAGLTENAYKLRLVSYRTTGLSNSLVKEDILISHFLRENWPVRIDYNVSFDSWQDYHFWTKSYYTVDDLNGDSLKEIIVVVSGNPGRIFVFNHNGTIAPGWPVEIPVTTPSGAGILFDPAPVTGDIDLDGKKEILTGITELELTGRWSRRDVLAYNHDGTRYTDWQFNIPDPSGHIDNATFSGWISIANLDLQGNPEIILSGRNQHLLFITDHTGTVLTTVPSLVDRRAVMLNSIPRISVGNLDSDPELEIVTREGFFDESDTLHLNTYAINMDGSVVQGWPVDLYHRGHMALADLDDDGRDEVLISGGGNPGIFVLDDDGSMFPGWPQMTDMVGFYTQMVPADVDNDGDLEIIAKHHGTPYIFHHTGDRLTYTHLYSGDYVESSIAADVTGDGITDIIGAQRGGNSLGYIKVTDVGNLRTLTPDEFPRYAPSANSSRAVPSIADIDNDGTLELINIGFPRYTEYHHEEAMIMNGVRVMVWDLSVPNDREKMAWPMFKHDSQNTGRYGGVPNPPVCLSVYPWPRPFSTDRDVYFFTEYTDPDGYDDIEIYEILVNNELSEINGLYTRYNSTENKIYLRSDDGLSWLGGYAPGSDNIIENSFVKIICSRTGAYLVGTDKFNFRPCVHFKDNFIGQKNIYMNAIDSNAIESGWHEMGNLNIVTPTKIVSHLPDSGAFFTDIPYLFTTEGYDPCQTNPIVHFFLGLDANTFYAFYVTSTNKLWLRDGTRSIGGYAPGSDNVIETPYGKLYCEDTAVSRSGDNLTINWKVSFKSTLTGEKDIYLRTMGFKEGLLFSPLQKMGTINIFLPNLPQAPSGLSAPRISSTEIDLSWQDNSDIEDGFKLERRSDGGEFTQVAITERNITTYTDTDLASGTRYYYRVRAYNILGDSEYSNELVVITSLTPPSDLMAKVDTLTSTRLEWYDNSDNEDGFRIERSLTEEDGDFAEVATVDRNVTSCRDYDLTPNTTYYYRVCAYNIVVDSEYSNVVNVTMPDYGKNTTSQQSYLPVSSELPDGQSSYEDKKISSDVRIYHTSRTRNAGTSTYQAALPSITTTEPYIKSVKQKKSIRGKYNIQVKGKAFGPEGLLSKVILYYDEEEEEKEGIEARIKRWKDNKIECEAELNPGEYKVEVITKSGKIANQSFKLRIE